MTAPYDAAQGTEQRFTDALSGSDGTADPSVMMPVLDVYPDALSAPMPGDLVPYVTPPVSTGVAGVRAEPVLGPGAVAGALTPAQRRLAEQRLAQQTARRSAGQRPRPQPGGQPSPQQGGQPRPAPRPPASVAPQLPSGVWRDMVSSAADAAAVFRASWPGHPATPDASFQATHPQPTGGATPAHVAPAPPIASQYAGHGQARNDAHARAQEKRRRTSVSTKKSGSGWAVVVFIVVIMFATGIGQKIIDLITELLNR